MTFFRHLIHQPRKLRLRRALFQIHLWAGVLLSLYIVAIAITGSILVFKSELTRASLAKDLTPYTEGKIASLTTVLDHFKTRYPGVTIDSIQMPSAQMPAFLVVARDKQHTWSLLADPVTAKLHDAPPTWLDWIYDLHTNLLLGSAHGVQINGIGAVGLLLLTMSGILLWWSGIRMWTRGLKISFSHNWRRINYDAHYAIGFWTLFFASWWAISGIYFAWYQQVTNAVAVFSPLQGMRPPAVPGNPKKVAAHVSLDEILQAVKAASPQGHLYSLSDPLLTGSSVYALVDLRTPGDFSHRDIITIATADARILTVWHYGDNHSAGDWFLWAMHPLHFGTLWGVPGKILWATSGMMLAALAITGLLMYWNRYLRFK